LRCFSSQVRKTSRFCLCFAEMGTIIQGLSRR
jgi:hypothetical protein